MNEKIEQMAREYKRAIALTADDNTTVEIRKGATDGDLLATIQLANTNGDWKELNFKLDKAVDGVFDYLYFVFKVQGAPAAAALFDSSDVVTVAAAGGQGFGGFGGGQPPQGGFGGFGGGQPPQGGFGGGFGGGQRPGQQQQQQPAGPKPVESTALLDWYQFK